MDNLRIVLIVVALLVILALLIHGFWINKKERSLLFKQDKQQKVTSTQEPNNDDSDIIGDVRVISSTKNVNSRDDFEINDYRTDLPKTDSLKTNGQKTNSVNTNSAKMDDPIRPDSTHPDLNDPQSRQADHVSSQQSTTPRQHDFFVDETDYLHDTERTVQSHNHDNLTANNQREQEKQSNNRPQQNIKQSDDIVADHVVKHTSDMLHSASEENISSDIKTQRQPEPEQANADPQLTEQSTEQQSKLQPQKEQASDILVLYVTGFNGQQLQGNMLLNSILQSGFQFDDTKIFHRHVDPAGNGPILFSLANMIKPGYLDPDTMHEMTTHGVSIFMVVPTQGNNQQNFKLMLQTAQRIADDVNGVVLDDEQHMLTPQKITKYKDRIKQVCHE